jgi:tetratricopeptide (TPR) repeat protein
MTRRRWADNMDERKDSFNQIRLADDREQIAVVIELCRKHLKKFPKHGPAWLRYGMALVALARYAEAEKALLKALKLCPAKQLSIPYLQMGNLVEAKGDFKNAAAWYRKAVKHNPQDADLYVYLGENAWKRGLHKQAEAHYRRALKCSEGRLDEAYGNLGGILLGRRNYSEAIKYRREALKLDPKRKLYKQRLEDAELALLMTTC